MTDTDNLNAYAKRQKYTFSKDIKILVIKISKFIKEFGADLVVK